MKLSNMKEKENGVILHVGGSGEIHRRLLDMGIVKGSRFTMVRSAPFGDPINIFIKCFHLSLRREEADMIEVENLGYHSDAEHSHGFKKCENRLFTWFIRHLHGQK